MALKLDSIQFCGWLFFEKCVVRQVSYAERVA